ncbi:uncharacterized protein ALTATR162_LOCUS2080 [Alternaria atra]|uniref:Uncharacterized protein n=1 Tax=Alternaria atra TaxID=119953 RepID=A0A8J2I136_9PLEO|nr:uncharacterized protein ALTATR162_LOCUS2080 [Alternaria atra]CAG5147690.1 unnamed protein product [Alternaria atra]
MSNRTVQVPDKLSSPLWRLPDFAWTNDNFALLYKPQRPTRILPAGQLLLLDDTFPALQLLSSAALVNRSNENKYANHAETSLAILSSEISFGTCSLAAFSSASGSCLPKPRQSVVPHPNRKRSLLNEHESQEHVTNVVSPVRSAMEYNQPARPAQGRQENARTQPTPKKEGFSLVTFAPLS